MNNIFISQQHGCVYAILKEEDCDRPFSYGEFLIYTPLMNDGSYDTNQDNWDEVDEMALLGEEQHIQTHIQEVIDTLRKM